MISGVHIVLTGFPEQVHRIADVIEGGMPGGISWDDYAEAIDQGAIVLEGRGVSLTPDD